MDNKNIRTGFFEDDLENIIDLRSFLDYLLTKVRFVVSITIIFAAMGFLISSFIVIPKYTATVTFYVNNNKNSVSQNLSYSDINAATALVPTYIELIKSNSVLLAVEEKINTGYSAEQLAKMISASSKGDETQLMTLQVVNQDPDNAYIIANAIADIAPVKIVELMEGSSVKVVDYALRPEAPTSPNVSKDTALAFILGLAVSIGIVFLRYMFETSIKTDDDLRRLFPDIPIIGTIPEINAE